MQRNSEAKLLKRHLWLCGRVDDVLLALSNGLSIELDVDVVAAAAVNELDLGVCD